MEAEWYVQNDGGRAEGPLTVAAIKARADSGAIGPNTMVRKGVDGKWATASKVKGLFPQEAFDDVITQEIAGKQSGNGASEHSNPRLRPCCDCGHTVSLKAASCPECGHPFVHGSSQEQERTYPALRAIAGLNKFLAVVTAIACIIGLVHEVVAASNTGKEPLILPLVICLVLLPIIFWASAELILLLIDIEVNTRRKGR